MHNCFSKRVLRVFLNRTHDANQHFVIHLADDLIHLRWPQRQGAGFIKYDMFDFTQHLKGIAIFNEYITFCGTATGNGNAHRCGQSKGTRAGNNQYTGGAK